jgi:ribosomal protein S18 acetylase RimI-like enzyme
MPDELLLRPATVTDAGALASFGARAFAEHFGHSTAPADLAAYLAATYGESIQARELSSAAVRVFVAERTADGAVAGYAMLRDGEAPAVVARPGLIELARLYVSSDTIGRGLGARLLGLALDDASARGYRAVWLSVWEENVRARAFYARHGFRDAGAHTFMIGADAQTDRVLVRES